MPCYLASFLSAAGGLFVFQSAAARDRIDSLLLTIGTAVYQVNRFGLSDQDKLAQSQLFALRIVKQLLLVGLATSLVVAVLSIPFWFVDYNRYSLAAFLAQVMVGSLPCCLAWFCIRKRSSDQEYPPAKQAFYYLTLGVPLVGRCLARWERCLGRKTQRPEQAVIVSGLARAGTTALLNQLDAHPALWSYTYRHMPFPMSSRLWLKLNRARSSLKERSHQDGILVGLDSPEAFDEYFWRVILKERFYRGNALYSHCVAPAEVEQYESLVASQLSPGMVYLSKNNNFLLRAESLLDIRPNYVVALVYRDPVSHSQSLLRQHRLQCEAQRKSPFVLDYMDMLGHHEFGLHRYDFVFPDSRFEYENQEELNYWLERWIDYYRHALEFVSRKNVVLVSNELLRQSPRQIEDRVLSKVGLRPAQHSVSLEQRSSVQRSFSAGDVSGELLRQAGELYQELNESASQSRARQRQPAYSEVLA